MIKEPTFTPDKIATLAAMLKAVWQQPRTTAEIAKEIGKSVSYTRRVLSNSGYFAKGDGAGMWGPSEDGIKLAADYKHGLVKVFDSQQWGKNNLFRWLPCERQSA